MIYCLAAMLPFFIIMNVAGNIDYKILAALGLFFDMCLMTVFFL